GVAGSFDSYHRESARTRPCFELHGNVLRCGWDSVAMGRHCARPLQAEGGSAIECGIARSVARITRLTARLAVPMLSDLLLLRAAGLSTDRWREVAVEPRRSTRLGVSFRPPQAD